MVVREENEGNWISEPHLAPRGKTGHSMNLDADVLTHK